MSHHAKFHHWMRLLLHAVLGLSGGALFAQAESLDENQQCDPSAEAQDDSIRAARPYKIVVRESAEDWADRIAKSGGESFYAALYYLPETERVFARTIGEDLEQLWVGFDQSYWPRYDEQARQQLRHSCARAIDASSDSSSEALATRRRIERWVFARETMLSLAHLDMEEMLTIAYLLPQTTKTFDWVFEQRPELERETTHPRMVGETLSSGESEYFMGLLFNRLSELNKGELEAYFANFHIEFEKLFPSDAEERLSEVELEAMDGPDAAGVPLS